MNLQETIKKILKDKFLKSEPESKTMLTVNELYNFFKENDFSGTKKEFFENICKISENDLELVSGGISRKSVLSAGSAIIMLASGFIPLNNTANATAIPLNLKVNVKSEKTTDEDKKVKKIFTGEDVAKYAKESVIKNEKLKAKLMEEIQRNLPPVGIMSQAIKRAISAIPPEVLRKKATPYVTFIYRMYEADKQGRILEEAIAYCYETRSYLYCEEITVPEETEVIATKAFYGCANLKIVNLPNTLTEIGAGAFYSCKNLEKISIPEGVKSITENTFYNCTNLKKINLPKSLKSIENNAFFNCESLEEITIPENTERVNPSAFVNCTNLKKINLPGKLKNNDLEKSLKQLSDLEISYY